MQDTKVSVIVTTKNESKNISAFCKSIKDQTFKNIELIIVDNHSTDNTIGLAKQFTSFVYTKGPERSAQRNYGAEKSSGVYLLILDADMILTPKVIESCVEIATNNQEIKAITIPEKSIGVSFWAQCKAFERNFYFLDNVENSIEAARFFDRNAFFEVGGYDPNITGPEDWDLPERIYLKYPQKYKIREHIIHNEGNVTLSKLIKKKFYYAKKASVYLDKNNISSVNAKTIYFLRPVFYKHWDEWFKNPIISMGTLIMLTCEFIAGSLGYIYGKTIK